MKESMQKVRELEKQLFGYSYAMRVIDFDSETVAPEDGNDGRAEAMEFLSRQSFDLLVNEAGMTLIVRTTKPLVTLDIRRQPMVVAFQEHLLRRADAAGFGSAHKERVRKELRSLLQRLSAPRRG